MSKTLQDIAQELITPKPDNIKQKAADEEIAQVPKLQLIYAFNGVGKTRLSREFRQLIAPKKELNGEDATETESSRKKILYYNAFTEDLFYWDNDLKQDAEPSSEFNLTHLPIGFCAIKGKI